jgi:ATP-dependent DNA helicase RecG
VHDNLSSVLGSLLAHEEAEWIEFKHNKCNPAEIGEWISAVSNAARLHQRETGYIIWGIEDGSRSILGTTFQPRQTKIKGQEIENWLATQLEPRIDFKIHEFLFEGRPVVVFSIQPCRDRPVSFRGVEYIRVGSYTKKLRDFPEKERTLWAKSSQIPFEREVAARSVHTEEVLKLLDHESYFELTQQPQPRDPTEILKRLETEKLTARLGNQKWNILNLGALLFARRFSDFESLARKAVRVVIYRGRDRTETIEEQLGVEGGYAACFAKLIQCINAKIPTNEQIRQALRRQVSMYPPVAVRELVANAIIHQDFSARGVSPMVEVFTDRLEITNPGQPLISTLRFIDEPPQSRNEMLAGLMRRLNVCEERGSGIDKVIFEIEYYQLPAPEFTCSENHTKVVMFAHKKFSEMDRQDRIRACYQHACLLHVSNQIMTNATLRKRFSIAEHNYSIASRIISDTTKAKLIKPQDPENTSRKHARYLPFWA